MEILKTDIPSPLHSTAYVVAHRYTCMPSTTVCNTHQDVGYNPGSWCEGGAVTLANFRVG